MIATKKKTLSVQYLTRIAVLTRAVVHPVHD